MFEAQLFPDYGRWGFDVADCLRRRESRHEPCLRNKLRAEIDKDPYQLEPLVAFEFCGALPAGNQAWQRCGRALACSHAEVPFFYVVDVGGMELDRERRGKAARSPNPLIPFAYLSLGQQTDSVAVPVFAASPSTPAEFSEPFEDSFGEEEALVVVRDILIDEQDPSLAIEALQAKATRAIQILTNARKRTADTLNPEEWVRLAQEPDGIGKAKWLITRAMSWSKKVKREGLTDTLPKLIRLAISSGAVAVTSRDMPLCIMGGAERQRFAKALNSLYGNRLGRVFIDWLKGSDQPLVIVWMRGFKPRGDDARPDRGLVPLARMIFGDDEVEYLTVIFGPAPKSAWLQLEKDIPALANANGLWEAILMLSDAVLVDSPTGGGLKDLGVVIKRSAGPASSQPETVMPAYPISGFGEHDVDSVIHTLLASSGADVFEAMCNPPGGDWSGISFCRAEGGETVRWTSLPRVSATEAKRPDHVAIFYGAPLRVLAIESKDKSSSLEPEIGGRLIRYVDDLLSVAPNVYRPGGERKWRSFAGEALAKGNWHLLSGIAFRYEGSTQMLQALKDADADVALAVEFFSGEERVLLHVTTRRGRRAGVDLAWLESTLTKLAKNFPGRLEVQIH